MANYTSNTYQVKREVLSFSNKISKNLSKPERKFATDMTYGMLAGGSCLLTDIADYLQESSRKINVVDRLSRHLARGTSQTALHSYLAQVKKWCPEQPVIHIDDSDVVKPDGYKFESLGRVRDGSKSTSTKHVYEKGYHITEAAVLTNNNHPVSIFSEIHSSEEKNFTSINCVTFSAMERAKVLFGKATFVMDTGYDDNKIFLKLDELEQEYTIECVVIGTHCGIKGFLLRKRQSQQLTLAQCFGIETFGINIVLSFSELIMPILPVASVANRFKFE